MICFQILKKEFLESKKYIFKNILKICHIDIKNSSKEILDIQKSIITQSQNLVNQGMKYLIM